MGAELPGYAPTMTSSEVLDRNRPGVSAEAPTEIPRRGWWQIAKRAWRNAQDGHLSLVAAGVAFYSFMALFPALIAALLLYGLVRDPADVRAQASDWTKNLPSDAASLITKQLEQLSASSSQSLGIGLVLALALALWSAAGGVGNLVTALNIAYDEKESRSFVKQKLLSLGLTLGAIVFAVAALALVAVAPAVLDGVVDSAALRWGLEAARWVLLLLAMTVALAVLYRTAPDRTPARLSWLSVGAVTATIAWLVASLGFSLYVDNFGSYAKTYGALAGVVVLLLWLWLTVYLVLLGAAFNASAEEQTSVDTTA
jgi:membrane protein